MTTDKLNRARRLQELFAEHPGATKADLARKCGVSPAAVAQWVKTGSINYSNVLKTSQFFGVSSEWLFKGSGEKIDLASPSAYERPGDDFVRIPMSRISNNEIVEGPDHHTVAFSFSFLAGMALHPDTCRLIRATNDRMAPTIQPGDTVLFATGDKNIVEGEIYVVTVDGNMRMCRLAILKNGLCTIPENPIYPRENFEGEEELARLKIFGIAYNIVRWL